MLKSISLQNFRSYENQLFSFEETTLIVGPNTSGKTNLIEAIYLLSSGKSYRTEKDIQMLQFKKGVGRVKGKTADEELEIILTNGEISWKSPTEGEARTWRHYKKFLVNGVARRRIDFTGHLQSVLFSPQDLDIIVDSPTLRRNFLDEVLEQVDKDYRVANISYSKALRQRNALLEKTREEGIRSEKHFEYWDKLVIENGNILTQKREEFINFANAQVKEIFDFLINYDKSVISAQRLEQYKNEEVLSGVTLVGPHRDDFSVSMFNNTRNTTHDIKYFGSRGQQRLAILQLKLLQLLFIEKTLGKRPILLLDDIFSELDERHINLIFEEVGKQQTIITTTHKEFIPKRLLNKMKVINFNK